jgi:hypothetical protein
VKDIAHVRHTGNLKILLERFLHGLKDNFSLRAFGSEAVN